MAEPSGGSLMRWHARRIALLLWLTACSPAATLTPIHPAVVAGGGLLALGALAPANPDSTLPPDSIYVAPWCEATDTLSPTLIYRLPEGSGASTARVTVDANHRVVSYVLIYPATMDFGDLVADLTRVHGTSATKRGFIWPVGQVTLEAGYYGSDAHPATMLQVYSRSHYDHCERRQ